MKCISLPHTPTHVNKTHGHTHTHTHTHDLFAATNTRNSCGVHVADGAEDDHLGNELVEGQVLVDGDKVQDEAEEAGDEGHVAAGLVVDAAQDGAQHGHYDDGAVEIEDIAKAFGIRPEAAEPLCWRQALVRPLPLDGHVD